jgi:hypothetical protein
LMPFNNDAIRADSCKFSVCKAKLYLVSANI